MGERKLVDEVTFLDDEAQAFIATLSENLVRQIDRLLSASMVKVTEFLAAEAVSIFLIERETGDLVLRYATGEVSDEILGLRLQRGQGVVGWVVKYGEDLIVPYPGMDTRFFEEVDERTGFSTHSIMCCPIQSGRRIIGAIEVLNKIEGTFNDDDLIVLRAIARLVASVIPRLEV
jgi:GAF domain-containing protein